MSTTIFQSYLGAVGNENHAFLAGGNISGQELPNLQTTTIDLDTVHFDPGGNFSTSTNAYTAPVDGIYFFHGQVLYQFGTVFNAGERTDIRLYKDGAHSPTITTILIPDEGNNYTNFFHPKMNGITSCTAGQEITMRVYQATGVSQYTYANSSNAKYTSFSGYLIQPT